MFTLRREIETIFIIACLTGVGLFASMQFNLKHKLNLRSPSLPAALTASSPTPTPTPIPAPVMQTTNTDSPDGAKTLIMKKQQTDSGASYSFSATDKKANIQTFIFSKTLVAPADISIPFNTWSPDNRYIFLKEGASDYYVWPLAVDLQTSVNITSLFVAKYPDLTMIEVTGWAAPDLLIVNAKNKEGSKSSLWFEVSSLHFIPLSTGFY